MTGRTTEQIRTAPRDAVFVWCISNLYYPKKLAKSLDRSDITIWGSNQLSPDNVLGSSHSAVVVDHATRLSTDMLEALRIARSRGTFVVLDAVM